MKWVQCNEDLIEKYLEKDEVRVSHSVGDSVNIVLGME